MKYFPIRRADVARFPTKSGTASTAFRSLRFRLECALRDFSDAVAITAPERNPAAAPLAENVRTLGAILRDTDPWAHRRPSLSSANLSTSES